MGLYPIQFVDVYAGNRFNAKLEKSQGMRGVIIKAGQGGYISLPQDFIKQCDDEDLPWGIYWLIDARYSADAHMNAIKRCFPTKVFGRLGVSFDCEKPRISMKDWEYNRLPYRGTGLIEAVTDRFLGWSGKIGKIYTSLGFANLLGWNSLIFKLRPVAKKLKKMPLWAAQYNRKIEQPQLFGLWDTWFGWQYQENPDYNYFNGTEEDWQRFLDSNELPAQDEDGEVFVYHGEVTSYWGVKVRAGAGTNYYEVAKALRQHTALEGSEIMNGENVGDRWLKIHAPVDGWVALDYKGQKLVQIEGELL